MKTLRPSELIMLYGIAIYGEKFNLNDPKRKKMYENAYFYFAGKQERTSWDISKGVLITGNLGVGKSGVFKVLQRIFNSYQIVSARTIADELEDKEIGKYHVMKKYGRQNKAELYIDDIGTENAQLYLFRNEVNIINEIILDRYDLWIDTKIRTFATTNLLPEQLNTNYGLRSYDRMLEMFNLISWEGKSLRL